MSDDRGARYLIATESRPLRLAVILDTPVTRQSYRRAIRALTGVWGGVRSALVTSSDKPLDPRWLPVLQALDPDAIFVSRRFASVRARDELAGFLDRNGINPRWIVPFNDTLTLEGTWVPEPIGAYLPETVSDSDELAAVKLGLSRQLSPLQEALLGLPIALPVGPRGRRRPAGVPHGLSGAIVRGSPIARSASVTPLFQPRPIGLNPYFFHERGDVECGLWFWNIRALRGGFRHGGIDEFRRYLVQLPPNAKIRRNVIYIGSLPGPVTDLVDEAGFHDSFRYHPVDSWAATRLDFGQALGRERDEVMAADGTVIIPARQFGPAGWFEASSPASSRAAAISRAVSAVDIALEPLDQEGLALSFPHRAALNDGLLPMERLARVIPTYGSYPRSRIGDSGNPVFLRPARSGARSIPLLLPTMANVLDRLDPESTHALSDKGRYARWMVSQLGFRGLHELLIDPRSHALLVEFQGQRLRFLTLDEMRQQLRTLWAGGHPGRTSRALRDEDWLSGWVQRQVTAHVLRQGVTAKCHECLAESFLGFGTFTTSYSCVRCGSSAPTPPIPRVGYQLGEVPFQFLSHNGGVSALALAAIGRRASEGFNFDFVNRPDFDGDSISWRMEPCQTMSAATSSLTATRLN